LHLGNARTFLATWLLARQRGWRIVLRIEDLDGPRLKRGADMQAIDDLRWLGLDWDEGPIHQSARAAEYRQATDRLMERDDSYPCTCSRREAQLAASAPHADDGSTRYPETCRGRYHSLDEARATLAGREPAIRFRVPDGIVEFDDEFAGHQSCDVRQQLGDFVITKSDGTAAYQLAVVVDDAQMSVTDVVRGDDLLDSTPRQILLYRALGLAQCLPRYVHLPLVVGGDGHRLAKRHGDTRLSMYRERGVRPGRIAAMLARWLGLKKIRDDVSPRELIETFELARVPRGPVVFTSADECALTAAQ
jgi:glutamyl-tRNA synthetase